MIACTVRLALCRASFAWGFVVSGGGACRYWTEPYAFEGGGELGVTVAAPIFDNSHGSDTPRLVGVCRRTLK